MSILKFVHNNKRHHLYEMYAYLADPNKTTTDSFIGFNVNPANPIPEMDLIQNYYHYPSWDYSHKTYQQIILSFDDFITKDNPFIRTVCTQVGFILRDNDPRQIFASIHFIGTNNIHCHYMLNYVDIMGNLYRQSYSIHHYRLLINDVLFKYNFPLIKAKELDITSSQCQM